MSIFFKSILSIFIVSIFCNFFIIDTTLAKYDYQLGAFASKAGYSTSGVTASLPTAIELVINVVLSLAGIFFLILVVYAGVRWMTAKGNEDNVTSAKNILEAAIIGLVVVSMSYAISTLIFNTLASNIPQDGTLLDGKVSCFKDSDCTGGDKCNPAGYCYTETCSDPIAKCGDYCSKPCQENQKCNSDGDCGINLVCFADVCTKVAPKP